MVSDISQSREEILESTETIDDEHITILHLSDFHFNKAHKIDIDIVLNSLLQDLEKLRKDEGLSPNMIILSGDIANTADQSDYNMALEWLNKLSSQTKVPVERFFIVPGNHDVNRDALRKFSKLKFNNENEVTEFLTKDNERAEVFKKLDNFFEFIKSFYGEKNPYKDRYFLSNHFQMGGCNIGVVGLNSSWFSGEVKSNEEAVLDAKSLLIGEYQARSAFDNLSEVELCFGIMHHPFGYLADFDEGIIKNIVMKECNIVFNGHTHSSSTSEVIEPDSRVTILSAGASYISNSNRRYNLCKINLKDFSYKIYLRMFANESKFWAKDTLTYQKGEGIIEGKLFLNNDRTTAIPMKKYPFEEPDPNVKNFVEHNWKMLLFSEDYEKNKMLSTRRKYFDKLGINPTLHDIAIQAIHYLLRNRIIPNREGLKNILTNSQFIVEQVNEFEVKTILNYFDEDYFKKLNSEVVFKSREEIAKLKEREFLIKKENEITQRLEKELREKYAKKEEQLKQREEQIKEEYKIFKSRIDDYQDRGYNKFPKLEKPKQIQQEGVWYEELGLKENPFPSHIGLEGFSEDAYDEIIVKTRIFHKFDQEIMKLPKSMSRTAYLVYGEMGSGKTTLFKYLQKTISLLKPNVLTMLIPLAARDNFEDIYYDFYKKLYERLELKYYSLTKTSSGVEKNIINDSTISYLFQQIKNVSGIDQFFIFIDDLHKHPKLAQEAFEFISGLQIFRAHMYENGINVTIFLSGDLSWISSTEGVRAIGGSIDSKERIPEISEEEAVEMINKRLKLFAKNKDTPPIIKQEYIKTIFKMIKARMPMELTFRDIMEEVEKHWRNHEFESLKLSFILDFNTLSSMLLDMETDHPKIKSKMDQIWDETDKDENIFNQFVEILNKLDFSENGVSENSHEFEEYLEYYGILYKSGLISKQRRAYSFVWVLSREVKDMFNKFKGKYGFGPSEYLSRLYQTEGIDKKYQTEESSRLNMILKTGGAYGEFFLKYVNNALESYRLVFKHSTSIEELYLPNELINLCRNSIVYIMKATIIICENKNINSDSLYDINEEFIENWFDNPDLTEFIDTIQKKELKETNLDSNDVKEICRNYFRAVKTTISSLQRFMKYNTIFTLDSNAIHISDKKMLNEIRRNFYNENFTLALAKTNSLMEKKLREIIYTTNCLLYGVAKWKRGLAPEINKKLAGSSKDSNEKIILNNLKMTELTKSCLNLDKIPEMMFRCLFDDTWQSIKGVLFLEKELQKITQESSINRKKEEILNYILHAKLLVEKVDNFYYKLFNNKIPFVMNYRDFGISPQKLDKMIGSYDINKEIINKIKSKVDADSKIELELSEYAPHASFQQLNFIDWIMYIYHMNQKLKMISINVSPTGGIIIT